MCRVWTPQPPFFSFLGRFSREPTSHYSALNFFSRKIKVDSSYVHRISSLKHHITDLHERAGRKITHLANTSQRIRFKQVEVRPNGAPPEPSDIPTSRKGKRAPKTQKVDGRDVNVMDLITGNIEPSSTNLQNRNGGMGNDSGGSESQISQPQPESSEQVVVSVERPSAPETATDS